MSEALRQLLEESRTLRRFCAETRRQTALAASAYCECNRQALMRLRVAQCDLLQIGRCFQSMMATGAAIGSRSGTRVEPRARGAVDDQFDSSGREECALVRTAS